MKHKINGKTLAIALAAVALVVFLATQAVLQTRLTELVRRHLLPVVSERLGVKIALASARVNLLRGELRLAGVELGQPAGFDGAPLLAVDAATLRLGGRRLMDGDLFTIRKALFSGASLTLVRDADGDLNVVAVSEHTRADATDAAAPALPTPASAAVAPAASRRSATTRSLPRMQVDGLLMPLCVRFLDSKIRPSETLEIAIDLRLSGRNLTAFGLPSDPWGSFDIEGAHADHPQRGTIQIAGSIAPITDAGSLSFALEGAISDIDPAWVMPYIEAGDARCTAMDLGVSLHCERGVFDGARSVLTLRMRDVSLVGKLAERTPKPFRSLPELALSIPVSGPLEHPELNWTYAVISALNEEFRKQSPQALTEGAVGVLADAISKAAGDTNASAAATQLLNEVLNEKQKRRVSRFLEKLGAD